MSGEPKRESSARTVLCVVGARPNFMKIAPIISAMRDPERRLFPRLLHTGQHYDATMNQQYFDDLGIPAPDENLEVGSASHAVQTAEIMRRFEPVLDREKPSVVLVVGDVNSTIACALVAAKKGVPVIHVEAGLRSFDRSMPEEINRVLTDQISDILFTTERSGRDNLLREGVASERIHFVGNVMIDTLHVNLKKAVPASVTLANRQFSTGRGQYVVLTLHRPANVDDPAILGPMLEAMSEVGGSCPVVFPVHPRTRAKVSEAGFDALLGNGRFLVLPPVGYLEMLGLMKDARVVMTDSGGIQEETTALGVPCITLRNNTERPITIEQGTNALAGQDPRRIVTLFREVLETGGKAGRIPEMWDGKASVRIAEIVDRWLDGTRA